MDYFYYISGVVSPHNSSDLVVDHLSWLSIEILRLLLSAFVFYIEIILIKNIHRIQGVSVYNRPKNYEHLKINILKDLIILSKCLLGSECVCYKIVCTL